MATHGPTTGAPASAPGNPLPVFQFDALGDAPALQDLRHLLFAPLPRVARALSGFDRAQLGAAIEVMIALLDAADADPEAEAEDVAGETVTLIADPDVLPEEGESDADLEENDLEDGFCFSHIALAGAHEGPGCNISDPDACTAGDDNIVGCWGDGAGDADDAEIAYPEWHTLAASARRAGRFDGTPVDPLAPVHEDAEDDDPDTGVEDNPLGIDPEEDRCLAGDDGCAPVLWGGNLHYGHAAEDGDCEAWAQPVTLNPA